MTEQEKQQVRDRIGMRISFLRKMAGLTKEQLAERAGLRSSNIERIEAGRYAVNINTLQAIAEALGMTVDIVEKNSVDLKP